MSASSHCAFFLTPTLENDDVIVSQLETWFQFKEGILSQIIAENYTSFVRIDKFKNMKEKENEKKKKKKKKEA